MYAVVKTGGKQYRVAKDDVLTIEKLDGEAGAVVELEQVLAINDGKGLTIGTPMIDGARVAATVLEQKKGEKVLIFKKKRRQNYRRTKGHRQQLTVIRISDILAKGQKVAAAKAKAASATDGDAPAKKAPAKAKAKAKRKQRPRRKKRPRKINRKTEPKRIILDGSRPQEIERWPIKKLVVVPVTVAIPKVGALASRNSVASR